MKLLSICIVSLWAATAWAKTETMETSLLTLTVTDNPYGYVVSEKTEKGAGQVLLENIGVTIGNQKVTTATLQRKGGHIIANMADHAGRVVFSFKEDAVLTVTITGGHGVGESFKDKGEHVYGIQGVTKNGGIDNRGLELEMVGHGKRYGTNWANARAPFYVTDRGYGIYAETMATGIYNVAQNGRTSFVFDIDVLTYQIIYGPTMNDIMKRYNQLAGPCLMPPDWVFSTIWWRNDTKQKTIKQDLKDLRRLNIPAAAHWIDRPLTSGEWGWGNMDFDPKRFPDPESMLANLRDNDTKLLVWVANRTTDNLLEEATEKGYLFKDHSKSKPAVDMRNPEAYAWYKEKLSFFTKFGVKGYKIDRGAEGAMPKVVQNENTYLYCKMTTEGMRDVHGDDHFVFARNVFDKARQYVGYWNGDTKGTFDGLKTSVQGALRCAALNISTYGSDTGGYSGHIEKRELGIRWLQFSTYVPMCQIKVDCYDIRADRNNPVLRVMHETMSRHHDLLPYTRSCTYHNTQTGMTVIQPMYFAFPDDARFIGVWDQYMYGPNLLIAPVVEADTRERKVLIPVGKWLLVHGGGKVYQGPAEVMVPAPLNFIPVLMREGSIIPYGDILQVNNNWTQDWSPKLRIEVFPGKKPGRFDYYTGSKMIPIACSGVEDDLHMMFDDPGHAGDIVVYASRPSKVVLNHQTLKLGRDYQYQSNKLTVGFSGKVSLTLEGIKALTPETTTVVLPAVMTLADEVHKPALFKEAPISKNMHVYIDRNYKLESMPDLLVGTKVIQTANNDRHIRQSDKSPYLAFNVSNETTVFVAYDNRSDNRPDWLKQWKDTGVDVSITKHPAGFRLYRKTFYTGTIVLGSNNAKGAQGAQSNYFVFMQTVK